MVLICVSTARQADRICDEDAFHPEIPLDECLLTLQVFDLVHYGDDLIEGAPRVTLEHWKAIVSCRRVFSRI